MTITEKTIPARPQMTPEQLEERLRWVAAWEKADCPALEQNSPLPVKEIYNAFAQDYAQAEQLYIEKRADITGVITRIGPDIHGKPSIELSDCVGGRCYALFVFANDSFTSRTAVGDTVVLRGNILNAREPFGLTVKRCEIIEGGQNMEKVCEFLQKAHVFYVATMEGDQPRVRPFGIAHIIDGKLCMMTGKRKPVSQQIATNSKVEVCACIGTDWVRIAGELVEDDRMETRQAMLDAYPFMKKTYAADDGNMQVLYFEHATAIFDSFSGKREVVNF